MRKMLYILSGSTDPQLQDYEKRYSLVIDKAIKLGYEQPEVVAWVGQKSGKKGIMNLESASSQLKSIIAELEKGDIPYDIIAFSWGANVYLNTLSKISEPRNLKRTVLWGPDEFWRMAGYFSSIEKTRETIKFLKTKDVIIDSDFFLYEIPNEFLLKSYPHSNRIRIGFGENDTDSPPAFADYLKSFVLKSNITYQVIANVKHVVTEYNEEYLNCLFYDIC